MSFIENMNHNIGDRFKWKDKDCPMVFEIIGYDPLAANFKYKAKCLESGGSHYKRNEIDWWGFNTLDWKYLGNFNKTNNFTELYDLLNS